MGETLISKEDQEIIDFLGDALNADDSRCALVLGPDFFSGEADELSSYIKKDSSNIFYLPDDGLMYFKKNIQPREKTIQYKEIVGYLKSKKQPDIYADIARLPFSLVLSLSPDDFLLSAYDDINKPYYFYYYRDEFKIPDKLKNNYPVITSLDLTEKGKEENLITDTNRPLVLNMFGYYNDTDSLVYTHHALFEYLYSLPITKLPETIRFRISEKINTFLIIGVHFNRWYLKLIFFLLSKLTKENSVTQTAIFSYNEKSAAEIDFYKTYFQIEFLKIGDKDFIKALIDKTSAEKLFHSKHEKVKMYFENADYINCIKELILRNGDADGSLTQLISRYNDNEKQWQDGLREESSYKFERNKIRIVLQQKIAGLEN